MLRKRGPSPRLSARRECEGARLGVEDRLDHSVAGLRLPGDVEPRCLFASDKQAIKLWQGRLRKRITAHMAVAFQSADPV